NFNDTESYEKYGKGLKLEDWRRDNVNTYVRNTYNSIKQIKPWVQFGISPFGVWRNKSVDPRGSDTQAGQTNYDDLFADPMAWMEDNYIDYILPQLYWSIDHRTASYAKLIKWWSENSKNTAVYIGNGTYKINADSDKKWFNPKEIPNQIDLTRSYANINGNAFFSAKWFVNKNKAVTDLLLQQQYKYPALPYVVPNSRKLMAEIPTVCDIKTAVDTALVTLTFPTKDKVRYVMVYGAKNNSKVDINNPSFILNKIAFKEKRDTISIALPKLYLEKNNSCALTFIDYYGNESQPTFVSNQPEIKTNQSAIKNENRQ
ncbi:family 10 glycosylhydrolase, partial [Flavobacterium sp.]|uniref:glycoside hydrolase family 10 protein n=1 Tax=Flavobacterium sp. TaxID=239 RepID=UPI00261598A4